MSNFKDVVIIGFGLIGSSLARALKKADPSIEITAIDMNHDYLNYALDNKLVDAAYDYYDSYLADADIIVLCTPIGQMGTVAESIAPYITDKTIVTDAGSVKQSVIDSVSEALPYPEKFVAAHPIAGAEKSGPSAGFATLFTNRWLIITPIDETDLQAVEKVTALWELCGANIDFMEPRHHDLVLAITSHLPHLIAYSIVGTATNMAEDLQREVIKYSAGGFRDFTRIAGSDPVMWRDIFIQNKESVLDVLQRFTEDLSELQKAIRQDKGAFLQDQFTKTRKIRNAVVDSGQAGRAPYDEQ
ncbi:MAG: prephenate/arogenate dehydrogenase family protein [Pseudomonadota bacterium]|nr:cyclohexadienyl dehydrogenase [Alphaproteobacteria bacterium]MCS5596082.1 prephenate/arogenate dehydrogenase family protein [Alphaproteobacteria bacterium]MEC7575850.1 prephenate/arogenate dehydrogenase family protein [Pseudomonadota bacterium]MEC7701897.1 prephenate/arogenate dehydrogenase family protein [Pseudomonadota bacterium]MED5422617.1 prephenate/arogenate dehydrogenase family protein [Pseudomonadota bacterium]|tara:strand:- start:112478 stop:113380 length:903 start_codon:yes stop_codon:yes gene_type:complete